MAVRISRFWRFLGEKLGFLKNRRGILGNLLRYLTSSESVPVLAEDRVIENNLLQQLNQLVGQVCRHERLDGDGHFLWVLRL